MLVSAAVCPHPPALVPAVSQGAAGTLAEVRTACLDAVARLRHAEPELLVCVGAGDRTDRWGPEGGGTLRPYGSDVRFGGSDPGLPLSLTIAAYLLEPAGEGRCDVFQTVANNTTPDACRVLGEELAGMAERVAMLVMGDGSARRTTQSPGPFDDRAEEFDAAVVRALVAPDPGALLAIEPTLAEELWVAGRAAWQVLAGGLLASPLRWSGSADYSGIPLGVGYVVVHLIGTDPSGC